jgi:DNA-binding transcriptional ArsR family regulator
MVGKNGVVEYLNKDNGNGVTHLMAKGKPTTEGNCSNAATNGASGNGTRPGGQSIPVNWERLARATAHPLRVSILEILGIDGGRVLSPSDLSHELQIPLSNTNYHVTELAKAGLIVLVRQRAVRGATEHFYTLLEALPKVEAESATAPEPARV